MGEDRPIVVKIGGSLLDWPELGTSLRRFLASSRIVEDGRRGARVVLVVGGGPAVDFVRMLDEVHDLGDVVAHRLALRGMDLSAHALAAILGRSRVVQEFSELGAAWSGGITPILAPRMFLETVDEPGEAPLPRSWDVTSDSIAARVAVQLGAGRLILLKSAAVAAAARREAVEIGLVDPYFPAASAPIERVEVVAFRDPAWTVRLLIS